MNYPKPAIWLALTERQRAQVIAILVQILLRQLTKKEQEAEPPCPSAS
jgi:hypothetical protein